MCDFGMDTISPAENPNVRQIIFVCWTKCPARFLEAFHITIKLINSVILKHVFSNKLTDGK